MENETRQAHWENVYTKKGENEVSWYQESPAPSLELLSQVGATSASAIIDARISLQSLNVRSTVSTKQVRVNDLRDEGVARPAQATWMMSANRCTKRLSLSSIQSW